jgi:mono/diheme cytochrome c family protein
MMNKQIRYLILALLIAGKAAIANEVANRPEVDSSRLPKLGQTWLATNPYRGNPEVIAVGQLAYGQTCARCHGADASTNAAPAPDLRKLNAFCRRIENVELKAACMGDNDAYFSRTVRQGKTIVGVVHMPAWEPALSQELIWAVQSFIESRVEVSKR